MAFDYAEIAASLASTILAFIITYEARRSFKYTRQEYLLNFFFGFLLLAVSFVVLIPVGFGINIPTCCGQISNIENYPLRLVIQSFSFILIALAYSRSAPVRQLLYVISGALIAAIILVLLPQVTVPNSIDGLLRILNTGVLAYVLYHMLRLMRISQVTQRIDLVFVGFLLIAISEYTGIIYEFSNSPLSSLFQTLIQLLGLLSLVVAFVESERISATSFSGLKDPQSDRKDAR